MLKTIIFVLSAIITINGVCTTNTLSLKSDGGLCNVCVDCDPSVVTTHVLGDFDSVFTNSDPTNCPILSCSVHATCDLADT